MKTQNKKGFSIIEIIIYLAIFTSISVLVINSFILILSSFNMTNMNRKILESGIVSMERISREIRQSKSVDVVNSLLGNSAGVLQLNSTDIFRSSMIIKFINENGDLNLYKDDILQGNLLGKNISIINLTFRYISTTQSEAIKIEMTLQYSGRNKIETENFYNTIVLRGSY